MPRLVPLLVALLAVTAGCTGGPVAPGATDTTPAETDSPTATDAPPTTDEPTSTPTPGGDPSDLNGTIAPGVTADGIENASALLDAHADGLGDRGYELSVERQFTRDGETLELDRRVTAAPELDRVRANATNTLTGNLTIQRNWLDESMERMLVRMDANDETRYRIPPVGPAGSDNRAWYGAQYVGSDELADLLAGGEFEVTGVDESAGRERYTLVGANFTTEGAYGERDVRLTVDGDGVIHQLSAEGSMADGNGFAFDYRVERLDVEAVDRPDWVADAPEPIDTRPTTGFENCSTPYLTLANEGSDAVPDGSVVALTLNGTEHEAILDEPLETGERRALYLDTSGELLIAGVDSVPANRTAMPNEAQIVVTTGDGMLLTNGAMGFGCESAEEGGSGSGSEGGSGSESSSATGSGSGGE